jgi:hypothetical protein
MGWMSGWNSRQELVDHLTTPHQWNNEGKQHTLRVIKKCFRGNNLWTIMERVVDGQQTDKFIVLFMLKPFGHEGWGYKDVEETCGPTYYNCPVSWLDEVPDPGSFATAWRENVRQAATKLKAFKDGQRIVFPWEVRFGDGVTAKEFTVEKFRRRTLFRRPDGVLCRLTKRIQEAAQLA